jgi:hypothetical protein
VRTREALPPEQVRQEVQLDLGVVDEEDLLDGHAGSS